VKTKTGSLAAKQEVAGLNRRGRIKFHDHTCILALFRGKRLIQMIWTRAVITNYQDSPARAGLAGYRHEQAVKRLHAGQ
jgi:hypothetical protein